MLQYSEYEKILRKGKKIEWYETLVPEKLVTKDVQIMAQQIVEQINKLEAGVDSQSKKTYISSLWENVRLLPYRMNGDFYLIKKREIEEKISKEVKPKKVEESIKEVTTTRKTKNSQLIFGSKKK